MYRWIWPAAVLIPIGVLPAQDPNAAKANYDELVAELEAATTAYSKAVRAITQTDEYKALRESRDREGLTKLMKGVTRVDLKGFIARFQEGAKEYAGTDGAIDYLTWLTLHSGDAEVSKTAAATLLADHIDSDKLEPLAENLHLAKRAMGAEWQSVCEQLAEKSPHDMVRAWALYRCATMTARDRDASAKDKAAAQEGLAEAAKLAAGTPLADMIAAPEFQKNRLQIGMEVPDIVGEDLDGIPFKLSDYRGKVVVIDFWGDW